MPTAESLSAYFGGGGQLIRVAVPDPAVGSNFAQLVPPGREWRLLQGAWLVTADVTVIIRVHELVQISGGVRVFTGRTGGFFVGGSVSRLSFARLGYSLNPDFRFQILGVPDSRMLPGDTIVSSDILNLQPGDAITEIQLLVEQFRTTA